jgi:WG containing repeat
MIPKVNTILRLLIILILVLNIKSLFSQNLQELITHFNNPGKNQIVKIEEMNFNKIVPQQSLKLASLDYRYSQPNYNKKIPFNDYKVKIFTSIYFYGQKENERWDIYGLDDKLVFKKDFIDIVNLGNDLFLVRNDDDSFGIINKAGKTIVPFIYRYIHKEWGFLIGYRLDGQNEILTLEGKSIFKGDINYGDEYINQNNLYGILTKKYFIPPRLDDLYYDSYNDILNFSYLGSKGLLFKSKVFYPLDFEKINLQNNIFAIEKEGKKLLFDTDMNQLFDKNIKDYIDNNDSTYFVQLEDKWLWFDSEGNKITNEEYILRPTLFRTSSIYKNIYYIDKGEEKVYFNKKNNFPRLLDIKDLYLINSMPFYFAQKKDSAEILNRFFVKIASGKYVVATGIKDKILLKKENGQFCVMDTFGRVSDFDYNIATVDEKKIDRKLITQHGDIKYYKSNGKFGIERNGKWTVPFIDKFINQHHSLDFLFFEYNSLYGLISKDTMLYPTDYRFFQSEDNLIRATKTKGFFDLFDMNGKMVLQNLLSDSRLSKSYGVKDGMPIFYTTDLDGKLITVENLKFISLISNGFIVEQNELLGVLDEDLKLIIDVKYKYIESIYYSSKSYIKVTTKDNKYGLFDLKGDIVLEPKYDQITRHSDNILVKLDGKELDFNRLLKREKYNELFID